MRSALSVFAAMCMWHMYRYMYCTCTCTVVYVHVCDKFPLRRCSLLVLVTNSAHALVVCSIRRTPKWPVRMRVAPEGLLVLPVCKFHWSLLCVIAHVVVTQTFWQQQPHGRKPIPKRDFLMPIYTEKFVWFCEKGARKKHADFCELTTNKCRLRNWIFNGNALRTIGTVVKRPTYDGLRVADLAGVYCMIY